MKNKILVAFAASLVLLNVTAVHADNALAMQNGFYVGVDAGAANLMNKESHSGNPESHQLGAFGPVAGVYAGYDYGMTCQYRIAVEAFLDETWSQMQIEHAGNSYKMNQLYHFGARLLPEYVFTSTTFGHIILGYTNGRFNVKDNGVYGFINSSYNTNGFQTGIGFDTVLINNFFIRLDGLYDMYSSNTQYGTGLNGTGSAQAYTNRFSQLAGELSIYYKFS